MCNDQVVCTVYRIVIYPCSCLGCHAFDSYLHSIALLTFVGSYNKQCCNVAMSNNH